MMGGGVNSCAFGLINDAMAGRRRVPFRAPGKRGYTEKLGRPGSHARPGRAKN